MKSGMYFINDLLMDKTGHCTLSVNQGPCKINRILFRGIAIPCFSMFKEMKADAVGRGKPAVALRAAGA
jgi:hypothetical protein